MSPQKYPIGIETFSEIIEGRYAYVDKTEVIYRLIQSCKYVFLSRPRRFGKSLMLSTMEAYFEGRKELFEGLWLGKQEGVDWTRRPVFRLNFVTAHPSIEGLNNLLEAHLQRWERIYGVEGSGFGFSQRFYNVVEKASESTGKKVVILIDEYDKLLVNTLYEDKPELHEDIKSILKSVFSVLKGADRYIEFGILTGVSRFSKLSIFSDINNLEDISLNPNYAALCGITEDEVRRYFASGVEELATEMDTDFEGGMQILKENYDGYHFAEMSSDIYNPFSLITSLKNRKILHRWFESGTPTFLLERIRNSDENLEKLLSPAVSAYELQNTSISDSNLTNLLYQTGYLTIKSYDPEEEEYILGLPNKEVEMGVYKNLLPFYTGKDLIENNNSLRIMRKSLNSGDANGFLKTLQSFMAGISYTLTENKNERYFQNNLFVILSILGVNIKTEVETSDGRIDAVIKAKNYIYIVELKLDGTAEEAMTQIHRKRYDLPYRNDGRPVILLGVNFSKETRTLDSWVIE